MGALFYFVFLTVTYSNAKKWRSSSMELARLTVRNDTSSLDVRSLQASSNRNNSVRVSKRQKQDPMPPSMNDFDTYEEVAPPAPAEFEFDEFGYPLRAVENAPIVNADYPQYTADYELLTGVASGGKRNGDIRRVQSYSPSSSYPPHPRMYPPPEPPKYAPQPQPYKESGKKQQLKIFGPPTTYGVSIFRPIGSYYPGAADGYGAGSGPIDPPGGYDLGGPPATPYGYHPSYDKRLRYSPASLGRVYGKSRALPQGATAFTPTSSTSRSYSVPYQPFSQAGYYPNSSPPENSDVQCHCICPCDGKNGGYPVYNVR